MVRTSFVYHQITAMTSYLATLVILFAFFKYWKSLKALEIGLLLFILSISWGVHCLLHFWEEYLYDFDPLLGRTKMLEKVIRCC